MKKIFTLILSFGLLAGITNGQVLDVTFDQNYITAKGWVTWEALYPQGSTPDEQDYGFLPEGFGVVTPTYSNGMLTPMYVAPGYLFTMGAPENGDATGEDTWLTYTATGLTVGSSYNVVVNIDQFQGWDGVSYTLAAWNGARPADGYVVANEIVASPVSNYALTGTFIASHTEMTFGVGAGKDGKYFHKTQIIDWTIEDASGGAPETEANIAKFDFASLSSVDEINAVLHTVTVTVPQGSDISSLIPDITLSPGATSVPSTGIVQDFTSPVTYSVTAQDGETKQDWVVTVLREEASSSTSLIDNYEFNTAPVAPKGLTALDSVITAGDIMAYSYEIAVVKFSQDTTGRISGKNSGYINILHQGWAPGYVRIEVMPFNIAAGNYVLSFKYDCGSDVIALTPAIIGAGGVESPVWSDATTKTISGSGTYSTVINLSSSITSAKFMILLGLQNNLYNSGKSFYIDALILEPEVATNIEVGEKPAIANIYPNPAQDYINIDLSGNRNGVSLTVYNLLGVTVYENDNATGTIQVNNLENGLYLVKIGDKITRVIVE